MADKKRLRHRVYVKRSYNKKIVRKMIYEMRMGWWVANGGAGGFSVDDA